MKPKSIEEILQDYESAVKVPDSKYFKTVKEAKLALLELFNGCVPGMLGDVSNLASGWNQCRRTTLENIKKL